MKHFYHFLMILFIFGFTNQLYSQSVPSYVPTNGLVGWWGFNGNAQDGSGNGNHGTVNGATLTTDRFGNQNGAYSFANANSISTSYSPSSIHTTSYSAWFLTTNGGCIIGSNASHSTPNLALAIHTNTTSLGNAGTSLWVVDHAGSSVGWMSNPPTNPLYTDGNWHHIVGVFSCPSGSIIQPTHLALYVDGQVVSTILQNVNPPISPINIISNIVFGYNQRWLSQGFDGRFIGKLDDIGIWNRALTPQEITNLYNSQNPQPCTTSITYNLNIIGCGFAVLSSGDTVNQSGTYIDTLFNSIGCDSILNQIVTIQNPSICNPVPSYVPTNGLVGWWGFNGNAQDGSGNGNHGTVNGATLTTDRFGNFGAFLFSNNTNNITIPNLYQNNILSYSTTGWFKINQSQFGNGGGVILAGNLPLSTPAGLRFTLYGPHECTWQVEDGWNTNGVLGIDSNLTYNDNEWHFFAAVFNTNPGLIEASAFKIYIDNQLISTRTFQQHWPPGSGFQMGFNVNAPIINNSLPVIIGNSHSFTAGFNGVLDDISIYHRALTPQEITNLYNSQLPTQTSLCLPSITTNPPSSIGIDSVIVGGNITNDGGSSIVLRGVCYSTTPNPNMGNMRTEDGAGVGSFSTILRNLNPSTTYYVRSYAKNTNGVVVYGDEVSFSTGTPIPGVRCPGTPSVTDIDGNLYHTVQIGNQCWTQSNLKVSRYRNGDSIPTGLSNSSWGSTTSGAYAIYDNNPVNDSLYGKLYNHYAVMDNRGLCPTGWHVPTDGEWNVMVKFLDPNADTVCNGCWQSGIAGGALKSTAIQPTPGGWNSYNAGATNSSGFSAGPGGLRSLDGYFILLGDYGYWWSSSSSGSSAWSRFLHYSVGDIFRYNYVLRISGFSVRCLRD